MKNIRLLFAFLFIVLFSNFSGAQNGWTSLFDGKTLNGWKKLGGTANYNVENGMIVGSTVINSPNTFLCTEKQFGDFILELEVKIDDTTSNSGVQLRSHFNDTMNHGKGRVY